MKYAVFVYAVATLTGISLVGGAAPVTVVCCVIGSTPTYAGDQVTVGLAVSPAEVLPGAPPSFYLHVQNATGHDITFAGVATLHVTPVNGETFVAQMLGTREKGFISMATDEEVIRAGAKAEYVVPAVTAGAMVANGWFADPRLNVPGVYDVRMGLYFKGLQVTTARRRQSRKKERPSALATIYEFGTSGDEVLSNRATFEVIMPTGSDAKVWDEMKRLKADGVWTAADWLGKGIQLAKIVWEQYPDSKYIPYVVTWVATDFRELRIVNMQNVIDRDPDSLLSNSLRLGVAGLYEALSRDLVVKGDLAGALDARRKAALAITEVLNRATEPYSREEARMQLVKLPDRAYYEQLAARKVQ